MHILFNKPWLKLNVYVGWLEFVLLALAKFSTALWLLIFDEGRARKNPVTSDDE